LGVILLSDLPFKLRILLGESTGFFSRHDHLHARGKVIVVLSEPLGCIRKYLLVGSYLSKVIGGLMSLVDGSKVLLLGKVAAHNSLTVGLILTLLVNA